MSAFLSNAAIQMIALLIASGLVLCLTLFFIARAYLKLRTKDKSLSELAEDGERVKTRLERYAGIHPDD